MKKITRNIVTLMVLTVAGTTLATAQVVEQKVGDNNMIMNQNAVLEIESTNRGLLLPRLELTATDSFAPLTAHVEGMTVYNTATAGTGATAVTPGYYYNDGTKWVRVATGTDTKTEPWFVQNTSNEATGNNENIYQMGSVAIGTNDIPELTIASTTVNPKLHIAGDVSTTGKFYTTNSTYADYVFEKYFTGKSDINENYEFKTLNDVKDFIEMNHHLPGVTKISDLNKTSEGYTFDMTELSIQQLEKIEELYIHTIEQQQLIEKQQEELNELKERLERLEEILLDK